MAETLLDIIQQSINGLMYGAFYALIGIGFTLFFGVMKKFNLAYGPTIMAGIYLGLIPLYRWKAPMWVVFVTCVAGAVVLGFIVDSSSGPTTSPFSSAGSSSWSFSICSSSGRRSGERCGRSLRIRPSPSFWG